MYVSVNCLSFFCAGAVLLNGVSILRAGTVMKADPGKPLAETVVRARFEKKPVKIELGTGRYELAAPLVLDGSDSGLTIAAADGARPVIAGSTAVKNWKLADETRNLWQAEVPGVNDGSLRPRQMFVDGKRAQRARSPNEGFFNARGGLPRSNPLPFPAQAGTLKTAWAERGDVEIVFFQKWISARLAIKSVDEAANTATLNAQAAEWMSEENCRYYIENAPEALDATGEWHLDRKSGVLSYLAPKSWDPAKSLVTLPRTKSLVDFRESNGVTLRGITFAETDYPMPDSGQIDPQAASTMWGAIRALDSSNGVIEDCTIENAGGYALDLAGGCRGWRITGNSLLHSGAGGVRIGNAKTENPAGEINFTDNIIAHYGRIHPAGVGVLIMQSGKNRIAHNLIHDGYYTGISVGWTWGYRESPCRENVIEFNHVHTIGQGLLSDMGGIYTLGPQPGTVIRSNYFHDIVSYGYGGWGLYTDEGSSGIVMENNLVARCKSAGFHQHYGKDNIVRNNVLAWNREHSLMRSREEEHNSFTFEHNIIVADSGDLLGSYWANDHYTIDRNCWWDTRHGDKTDAYQFAGMPLPQWQAKKHDSNSVVRNPGVPAEGFPLPSDKAAAEAIGFNLEALPKESDLGPRPREARK